MALLIARDQHHAWARSEWAQVKPPLLTCEAVLSEAQHIVRRLGGDPLVVVEFVRRGLLDIPFQAEPEIEALIELERSYADDPRRAGGRLVPWQMEGVALDRAVNRGDAPSIGLTIDSTSAWIYRAPMQTTVTTKNMVTIPAELSRKMGITPGCRLEWREPEQGSDEVTVRVIPTKAELARRLFGRGARYRKPGSDPIAELIEDRVREDDGRGQP